MVIGNWKSSALLGLVAGSLWGLALTWYFIGNHRLGIWWKALRTRMGLKPNDDSR